jgi:23S rRNA (guanosine2251-2'-O)-methyltransferase
VASDRKTESRRDSRPAGTSRILAGRQPVLELLRGDRVAQRILIAKDVSPSGAVGEIRRRAASAAIPVRVVPRSEVDRLAPELNHQGVVAVTARYRYAPLEDLLSVEDPALLFLDGITDPHNLGSLLRSADGAGLTGVVIPARRSVGVTAAVRRVAAGAAEFVRVARVGNLGHALDAARAAGLWIVGLDANGETALWDSDLLEPPVGIALGAEGGGLSRSVRERCDALLRIPIRGRLGSLNVGVAGAIAMFELSRRRDGV